MSQLNQKQERRVPIRRRVVIVVLLTAMIILLAACVTGILCIRWIKDSSETALTQQLENNMRSIADQKAAAADAKLEHYEKYIEFVTDYIEDMYKDEKRMVDLGHMYYAPTDTHNYMLTRGFANDKLDPDDFKDELLFYSNLEQVWAPIAKANDDLISTLYAGSKSGLLTSYDKWSYLSVPEKEDGELIYDYYKSNWYTQGLKEKGVFYTGLYADSQGRGLTITVASPYRDAKGNVQGVNSADFDITGLYNELLAFNLGSGTFSFALDKDGSVLSPEAEGKTVEEYTGLSPAEIKALLAAPDGILEANGKVYVCTPVERVGWTLCACVPKAVVENSIQDTERSIHYALAVFIAVALLMLILAFLAVNRVAANITKPIEQLGRDMKIISDGDLDYRATVNRNDEIGDVTSQLNEMVDRLNFTMNELRSTQQQADALNILATVDSLTGVRNKTAYDEYAAALMQTLEQGVDGADKIGLAMVDLNNLKLINDSYGHDKGDIAIKNLSSLICETFPHSPVFRVGGDEFVVILQNLDLENASERIDQFQAASDELVGKIGDDPWDRVSAAIGYAIYDPDLDDSIASVLTRADQEMYLNKKLMKSRF